MATNFIFILLLSGILCFSAPKKQLGWMWHLPIFGALIYGIAALSDCFPYPDFAVVWEAMPNLSVLLNITPVAQTKELALGILILGAVCVFHNLVSADEQDKNTLNGLAVINIVLLLIALCSTNYFQLLAAVGMADVVVYGTINKYEAKRQYIYGNFLADFLLLNIFAIILGQHANIEIVSSGAYSTDWHHRDYIAIILLLCIFIKSGTILFHSAYQKMSKLNANRLNFILFLATPLMGAVILSILHDILDISRYSLPILRLFAVFTVIWGACGALIVKENHRKCAYMAMVFWGLYFCAFAWLSSSSPRSFIIFLGTAYLFNTALSLIHNSLSIKNRNSFIPILTISFAAVGYILAWWSFTYSNIILAIAGECVLCLLTSQVAFTIRTDYLHLSPFSRFWLSVTIIFGALAAFYFTPELPQFIPFLAVVAPVWIILVIFSPIAKVALRLSTENIQNNDLTTAMYETIILVPLQIIGRILRLTVDIVFLERTVISSVKNAIRFLIFIFRRLHANSVLSSIMFSLLGVLIVAVAYYNGVVK